MQELHPQNDTEHLRSVRDRFVAFAFASADILIELDERDHIVFIDGAISKMLGKSDGLLLGTPFAQLLHAEDASVFTAALADRSPGSRFHEVRLRLQSRQDIPVAFAVNGYRLTYLKNHVFLTLVAVKTDATAQEWNKRDIQSGLLRKQSYVNEAGEKIAQAMQSGKNARIMLLDFPELEPLLERMEPENAEALLIEIGQYLRSKSIGGEIAGMISPQGYSLVHDASVNEAHIMQDIIRITQKSDPAGLGLEVRTQSVAADAAQLTQQDTANALLYTINRFASQQGDDFSIHTLSGGYQELLRETIEKVSAFKQTVHSEKFEIAFQPIVEMQSGNVHHFEGLMRFKQGEGKEFNDTFHFITFGEQAGVIGEFDLAMCQKTVEVLQDFASKGERPRVSINISGKSLSSQLFKDSFEAILLKAGNLRPQILLEVTESAKIHDLHNANVFLQSMRQAGNLCCLDDFGVAESSFEYLHNLQVDFVKIDGSYVKAVMAAPRGRNLIKAIAMLCRELGITTIAEMVEDAEVAQILYDSGVNFGQGYYFGKPSVDLQMLTVKNFTPPQKIRTETPAPEIRPKPVALTKSGAWWSRKK